MNSCTVRFLLLLVAACALTGVLSKPLNLSVAAKSRLGGCPTKDCSPTIKIIAPLDGAVVKAGSKVTFEAIVFYDGAGTSCCAFKWHSSIEGFFAQGLTVGYTFTTPGPRTITATLFNKWGDGHSDTIDINVISKEKEEEGESPGSYVVAKAPKEEGYPVIIYQGVISAFRSVAVQDNSSKPKQISCQSRVWVSSIDPTPKVGCGYLQTFPRLGEHTVTVTATNSYGTMTSATLSFAVVPPPTTGRPLTTFYTEPSQVIDHGVQTQFILKGYADDPDNAGPLTYEFARFSYDSEGGGEKVLAAGTMADGEIVQAQWKPIDDLPKNCGEKKYNRLLFRVTDAEGKMKEREIELYIKYPDC